MLLIHVDMNRKYAYIDGILLYIVRKKKNFKMPLEEVSHYHLCSQSTRYRPCPHLV